MSIFFRREFYSKAVSLLLTLAFLVESTLAPILLFMPQTARAAGSPAVSLSSYNFTVGTSMVVNVSGGIPNTEVKIFCRDPNNVVCDDSASYTIDASGQFTHAYDTTGWTIGNYSGWVTVNGTKSNTIYFAVTSAPASETPPSIALSAVDTKINPSPIVLGQEVRFSTKLTVSGATAQNFQIKLDVSDSLQLKSAYRDANCSTSVLSDPSQPAPTRTGTKAYLWPTNYFSGGIAPGTYDFCFKFQAPANTSQSSASFYIDASSVTSTYNVTAKAVNGAAFSAPTTVPASMAIYRSPSTSQTNPYNAGDYTVSSSVNSPSLFATDYAGTGYNQIGSNPVRTFPFSTRDLVNSGACNASTGTCSIPGNWSATDFVCPAGVTGVQQMKEWYTIGNTTSNTLTWYFQCSVTTPTSSYTPIGSLGYIDTNGTATGWAVDPDSSATSISAHFYIDGAAGAGGTYAGSAVASLASSVANSAGYSGSHGYSFSIPQQWRDGKPHTLYVHGIDLSGDGSKNVILSGVPKSFTLGTPLDSTEPTLFVSPAILSAGSQLTISVADAVANGTVKVFCRDPNNVVCDDSVSYTTNASGQFTHTYDTTGWTVGAYQGWVTVNDVRSNTATFVVTAPISSTEVLSVGATAVYKGNGKVWVASRINADTILFERWNDPLSSTNTIWRSKSQDGAIVSESSSEIHYNPVTFYDHGMPADVFGQSDGPYDIWLAPTGLYIARSGQTKTLTATRIGYGTLPAFYSRQWCGLGTICNKALAEDQWDGWPIFGFMLQKENGTDIASIFTGPIWLGFEIIQASLIYNGTSKELRGQAYQPCSAWTTTLGLCLNGALYMAGANEVLRVKLDEQNLQWWYDSNFDGSVGCEEFGKNGAQLPDAVVPHAVAIKLTGRNSPTRTESSWSASKEGMCTVTGNTVLYPVFSLPSSSFAVGASFVGSVTQAVPNTQIRVFSKGPDGVTTEHAQGITSPTGTFSQTYNTVGWTSGAYQTWVDVNGVQSNIVSFMMTAPFISDRPIPTPTTAPMATLTLEREQEQVLPNQPISFSGTLDSSKVAFPQGSSLVMAISDGVAVDSIEIDGGALAASAFSVNGGSVKIPFSSALYNGSHSFRLVLRNTLPVQLDRRVSIWVTVVDAGNTLLLKGRTASTLAAHLSTEVIGRGTSVAIGTAYYGDGSGRIFRYLQSAQDIDITRGPFFTPTSVPPLPDNIAFTLFPGDASMQRVAFSLKQFSDPLAREFITAQYQYLLGRDPSGEEMSRYLPLFTQWRNSLGALMEVYNRRADVREFVRTKERIITGNKKGKAIYASNLPNYDKLVEWATTQGWKEEPTLQSFKMQTGYDDAWKLFDELQEKWAPLAAGSGSGWSETTTPSSVFLERNLFNLIFELCGGPIYGIGVNVPPEHYGQYSPYVGKADFAACWKDPLKRHQLILWAKDIGWAYNKVVQLWSVTGTNADSSGNVQTGQNIVEINPSGPILASVFGPGKYPEYAAETAMRYPPAQLYYDVVSSSEYASFPEPRFRKNIDSIFRLFYSRPATESDIAWTKKMFIRGGDNYDRYDPTWSWINQQWEPSGQLIASNFEYVDPIEFVKNPSYITDYFYGIRNIPGEIDAVSSRLIEAIEKVKYQRAELYQGNNFKRIVVGLYRLYLRRNPTDAELEKHRASGKDFGDIELKLNQSAEYGKNPASRDAVRSIYRNYLGRDPSDVEIASGTLKSVSSFANSIGTSVEMKTLAQAHRENVYIFPVKRIKIVKCGFFCSVLGKALGMVIQAIPGVGFAYSAAAHISCGQCINPVINASNIVLNSTSEGFAQAGFNGETFVEDMSAARAMAGQAGGVFSMTNLMENADPTILDGFRTMALAPQTPQGNAFAQAVQSYPGLASPLGAVIGLFGAGQAAPAGHIAQIDVSSHYGSGAVAPAKSSIGATKDAAAKAQFTKTLAQGSRGAEVLKLQKLLGEMDLTFLPEYQTGYYGAKTVAAVKRFQKRNGLEQVGFVGERTRALLNSAR